MPAHIEQTADRAQQLVETGEVATARAVLREALATIEPDATHASPSLTAAAMLYARVLVTLGEPATARQWAAYAHTASRRLYGVADERTRQAASVLAGVLYRAGAYSRSAHLYRELINQLSAADGPRSNRVLAARADLATVLHARGDCAAARDLLEQAWHAYRHHYGEDHPLGLKMLARLGVMERGCGLAEQARERFALAEALCRRHLPPGHRLTAQIDLLSRTPPDRRHVCDEPLALPGDRDGAEHAGTWRPETETALRPQPATAPPEAPVPPAADPQDDPDPWADRWHRMRLAVLAGVAVLIVTVVTIAGGSLIAQARSTVDDQRSGPAAAATTGPAPAPPSTAPATTRPTAPATTQPAAPATTRPAAPATTRPAPAPPPGPPTGVKLTDTRTAVALSWVYPAGARGQVVVSAAHAGQPRRTIQRLPAGTARFTVYGLAGDTDYCFAVGVAYSAGVVKTAPPVCTARH